MSDFRFEHTVGKDFVRTFELLKQFVIIIHSHFCNLLSCPSKMLFLGKNSYLEQ